jgi:hypothetical protein
MPIENPERSRNPSAAETMKRFPPVKRYSQDDSPPT